MPTLTILESFVKAVEEQVHDQVIEDYYTEDASIQENQNPPRMGKPTLLQYERAALAKADRVISKCIRPIFIDGDRVIIRWIFTFHWKNQTTSTIEEIAYQIWKEDKIQQEQFFYDPKQMIPS